MLFKCRVGLFVCFNKSTYLYWIASVYECYCLIPASVWMNVKFTPFLITLDIFGFYFTWGFFAKVSNVSCLTGLPVNDFFIIVFILNSDLINFIFLVIFLFFFFQKVHSSITLLQQPTHLGDWSRALWNQWKASSRFHEIWLRPFFRAWKWKLFCFLLLHS